MNNKDIDILSHLYLSANEQVKLYAEFRWKAFSFLFTLNSGLLYVFFTINFSSTYVKALICIIGVLLSILIYFFEKRHRQLFKISRTTAKNFERELILLCNKSSLNSSVKGVFTDQLESSKKIESHHFVLKAVTVVILFLWITFLLYFLISYIQ